MIVVDANLALCRVAPAPTDAAVDKERLDSAAGDGVHIQAAFAQISGPTHPVCGLFASQLCSVNSGARFPPAIICSARPRTAPVGKFKQEDST